MMSKLTAQVGNQNRPFKQNITKVKGEDSLEIIMIKIDIQIDTDQTVEIGECHIEVQLSMDKTMEEGCIMIRIGELT